MPSLMPQKYGIFVRAPRKLLSRATAFASRASGETSWRVLTRRVERARARVENGSQQRPAASSLAAADAASQRRVAQGLAEKAWYCQVPLSRVLTSPTWSSGKKLSKMAALPSRLPPVMNEMPPSDVVWMLETSVSPK